MTLATGYWKTRHTRIWERRRKGFINFVRPEIWKNTLCLFTHRRKENKALSFIYIIICPRKCWIIFKPCLQLFHGKFDFSVSFKVYFSVCSQINVITLCGFSVLFLIFRCFKSTCKSFFEKIRRTAGDEGVRKFGQNRTDGGGDLKIAT